ncbi:DUF11 domain-containing protein, partial [bacterium]|nr:DUF11 domain-containing protein [bacterium]
DTYPLPTAGPNTQTVTGSNPAPDLSVDKFSKDTTYFAAEDTVAWTITITNSDSTTSRTIITDTLPDFVTYQDVVCTSGHTLSWITPPGAVLSWVTDSPIISGIPLVFILTGDVACNDSMTPNRVQVVTGCPDPYDTKLIKEVCETEVESDSSTPYWQVAEHHPENFEIAQVIPDFGYCDTGIVTLTFSNLEQTGDITAFAPLIISDTIPAGYYYERTVSVSHSDTPDLTGDLSDSPAAGAEGDTTLIWQFNNTVHLGPQDTLSISFIIRSNCTCSGTQSNTTSLTAHTCFGETYTLTDPGGDTKNIICANNGGPDVAVDIYPDTFAAQSLIRFTFTITNTGGDSTSRTIVTDTLPTYMRFVANSDTDALFSPASPGSVAGETLSWVFDGPINGKTVTLWVEMVDTAPAVVGSQCVLVQTGCQDVTDSTAVECVMDTVSDCSYPRWELLPPNIGMTHITPAIQVCNDTSPPFNDTDTFIVSFKNLTLETSDPNSDLSGYGSLTIIDTMPAGLMYVYAVFTETKPATGTINPISGPAPGDTGVLTWILPEDTDFEPQDLITLELHIKNDTTQACAEFADDTNSVHILMHTSKGDTYGFGPETHDTATSSVQELDPEIDIVNLTFTDNMVNDGLVPGDTVTYHICVCNTGDGAARDVVITDKVDTDLEFISMSTTHGDTYDTSWDPAPDTYTATWRLQQLDAGACDTFT